jgi:hypothetical protein|uniref:Uncharacterized protein n=1 Tax=viral metagenome TaxID=1070528 RepID=A0A6C0EE92_9ZZZZ
MSSNRLIYDKCAYATEMKESTSSLEYNLFKGKYENSIQCPVGDFTNILEFGTRADVESELYGINRLGSLCPSLKYNPDNKFKAVNFTPSRTCDSIYFITPNNIEKPKTNMLNCNKIGF